MDKGGRDEEAIDVILDALINKAYFDATGY